MNAVLDLLVFLLLSSHPINLQDLPPCFLTLLHLPEWALSNPSKKPVILLEFIKAEGKIRSYTRHEFYFCLK